MTLTPERDLRSALLDPVDREASPSHTAILRGRYEAYCQQQVTLLLEIIPSEAVRPLYRRARTWATEEGFHESKDPMSTLRSFCREVLPLPPFEVWQLDYANHRVAHVSAGVERSPLAEPMEPIRGRCPSDRARGGAMARNARGVPGRGCVAGAHSIPARWRRRLLPHRRDLLRG